MHVHSVLVFTSGHRTTSGYFNHVSAQNRTWSAKMSGEVSQSGSSSEPPQKKRCVAIRTVQNWISSCDRELNTALWLKYEKYDRDHVASINCSICTTFDEKIRGSRNYNDAFIVGSTNLHTSSFRDHAKTDMHQRAMILFRKSQG